MGEDCEEGEGDALAAEELLPLVYDELHRLARVQFGGQQHHLALGIGDANHQDFGHELAYDISQVRGFGPKLDHPTLGQMTDDIDLEAVRSSTESGCAELAVRLDGQG